LGTYRESILTHVFRGGCIGRYDELFVTTFTGDSVDETMFIGGIHIGKESFFNSVTGNEKGVTGIRVDGAEFAWLECGHLVAVFAVVPVEVDAVGRLVVEFYAEFFVWGDGVVGDVDFAGGGDGGLVGCGSWWEEREEEGDEEKEQVHDFS
jgi:hypothetical protein